MPSNSKRLKVILLKIKISKNKHSKVIHNNLKIELMQWQGHRLRGSSFDNKKNISWPRESNMEN